MRPRYGAASARTTCDALPRSGIPDWSVYWPQSGERVTAARPSPRSSPTTRAAPRTVEITRDGRRRGPWVVTAGNTVIQVVGSGDFWWSEWRVTYRTARSISSWT
jgi:hypothetical protein